MLDADTGNFSPELRERIVSAELADTESLTPARRTKLRQKGELLDVVRDMIAPHILKRIRSLFFHLWSQLFNRLTIFC